MNFLMAGLRSSSGQHPCMENRAGKGAAMLFASAVGSDEQQGDLIIGWPMPKAANPGFET